MTLKNFHFFEPWLTPGVSAFLGDSGRVVSGDNGRCVIGDSGRFVIGDIGR